METADGLLPLAELLLGRPADPEEGRTAALLTGLAAERERLGKAPYLVVLHSEIYGEDGLAQRLHLLEAATTPEGAKARMETAMATLMEARVRIEGRWQVARLHEPLPLPPADANGALRSLYVDAFEIRAEAFEREHHCFRVIGSFGDWIVDRPLIEFFGPLAPCLSEYFAGLGSALLEGEELPDPLAPRQVAP